MDVEDKRKQAGRRTLLKAGGFVAAGGALGSIGALMTDEVAGSHGRKRARWIKVVDRPTLGEKAAGFTRFSGFDMFALYPRLKNEREGAGSFEAELALGAKRLAGWISEKKPGYSLPDYQLSEGAWTVMHSAKPGKGLLSWTRLTVQTPEELGAQRFLASQEEMAGIVKAAARLYGAGLVGIAPMNEAYVNLQLPRNNPKQIDKDIVFEDVDVPAVTDSKFVIPRRMKWVVAIAIPMDLDLLSRTPTALGDAATAMGYSHSAFVVSSLAEFIRGLGYQAIPSVNDTAQSIPFAVDAGIGELSRLNRLVTPEFGAAVRLCKVFTDLPMACDKPVDFGLVEFCKTCKKCAESCPSRALSFDDEPSFKTKGPWNNSGHKAWFEDSYKCFQYWQKVNSGCGICLASCPYTKGAQAWMHEAVKATASIAPAADGVFRIMDNAFGYGKQRDPEQWWTAQQPSARKG
jgi:reductive dehalogenase